MSRPTAAIPAPRGADPSSPPPPSDRDPLLIRSTIISSYAEVARAAGLDPQTMLVRAGIDPRALQTPDLLISATRITELIERSAIEGRARDFGFRLALARGNPDLGPLNLLLREEPDLRSAILSLQGYMHVHSRSLKITLQEGEEGAIITGGLVDAAAPFPAPRSAEMILTGIFLSIRWLVGPAWTPSLVCFSHAADGGERIARHVFGCPVEFGHGFDGLVISEDDLARPVGSSDPGLRRYAEDYVRLLAERSAAGLEGVVVGLIAGLLPSGTCSSSRIARHLGMDRTTLTRRLASVGTSYSQLLQATRTRLANRFCLSGAPLEQVGEQLGFASPSTFSRWFATSFGCSATQWRRRHAAGQEQDAPELAPPA